MNHKEETTDTKRQVESGNVFCLRKTPGGNSKVHIHCDQSDVTFHSGENVLMDVWSSTPLFATVVLMDTDRGRYPEASWSGPRSTTPGEGNRFPLIHNLSESRLVESKPLRDSPSLVTTNDCHLLSAPWWKTV